MFVADCITTTIKTEIKNEISKQSELDFETLDFREDKNSSIKEITRVQKVRLLDRSIGD